MTSVSGAFSVVGKLIKKLKQGDDRVLQKIIDLYQRRIYNFALLYVRDKYVAEEIVNDVFVILWERRATLKDVEDIRGYLLVITRNLCLNYLRKENIEMIQIDSLTEEQVYQKSNLYVLEDDILFSVVEKDYKKQIGEILERLPDKTRNIFLLSRRDCLKNKEIAERLNILEKVVEYHITKALSEIRKNLFK